MPFPILPSNSASGYFLTKSLRFRSSASAYLNRTPASAGNLQAWTWSGWVKLGIIDSGLHVLFQADTSSVDTLEFDNGTLNCVLGASNLNTTAVFRDPAAWYHIVWNYNGATQNVYVNNVLMVSGAKTGNTKINSAIAHYMGTSSGGRYFDGYMAEVNFIGGQALTPSSFGSTNSLTGVWQPAKYTGTYGTNGFYLPFTNTTSTTTLGYDFSGNGNNWTTNNFSLTQATVRQTFSTVGTTSWTAPTGVTSVDYLVVAGGGGGGGCAGFQGGQGGGGAGGMLTGTLSVTPGTSYTVTVGAGGTAGIGATIPGNGGNSVFSSITATGGGAGGSPNYAGQNGGSGGGGSYQMTSAGTGISGQGYAGGPNTVGTGGGSFPGGGGGGAGAVGANGDNSGTRGNGGVGLQSSISGTSTYYAGGGGGGANGTPGTGGSGGGGAGGNNANGSSGTANTGGGGGGCGNSVGALNGGAGGSGIVIISYSSGGSSTYDSMTDVPTLTDATTANYCTFNPVLYNAGSVAWSDGNLLVSMTGSADRANMGTMAVGSGKYYWELTITAFHASGDLTIGIGKQIQGSNAFTNSNMLRFNTGNGWYYYGTQIAGTNTGTWALNDVIGVALDMTGNNIYIYQNNTLLTSLSGYIDLTVPHTLMVDPYYTGTSVALNCGQQGFKYTPPTGYVALNTYNLPTSTIVKGNTVMDATTYTGTGSAQSITNAAGFKPDFVWAKNRSLNANGHLLFDSIRGVGNYLQSNSTGAESFDSTMLTAFNSNGFSVSTSSYINGNTNSFVGWQWQAGQGSSSSNTSGSITSTVSVNATAGFSVVTYTGNGTSGATIGHGLGVAPKMIIVKRRDAGGSGWSVYFTTLPAGYVLSLQSTNAQANSSGRFTTTLPTSSVFSVGTDSDLNGSGGTYVAYCWAEIAGFSSFGSYTGNGSADGPFVYTGFRPKFVLIKSSSGAGTSWIIYDSSRNTYNATTSELYPNTSGAETNSYAIDFLSNGFKIRNGTTSNLNDSGSTQIYAAFAENPFKNALAR